MRSLVVLVASLVALPLPALAQSDPLVGTWVLNVAKSKYSPGPPPKSQTSVYEAVPNGVKVTTNTVSPEGKPIKTEYTAKYDGKEATAAGNPDWDAVSLKRTDSHTVEFTRKRGGKVVQTGTIVVSKDGMTRTVTTDGVNAKDVKIHTVAVYEKKQSST